MTAMDADPTAAQREAAAPLPEMLRAAMSVRDSQLMLAFWNAYFRLPRWLLISRGSPQQPSPFVIVADDKPTILVFSDAAGAQEFGVAAGLTEQEASTIMAVPMPAAVDWVSSFVQFGVQLVRFDAHVDGGVVQPLANLPAMRADLLGSPAGETPAG